MKKPAPSRAWATAPVLVLALAAPVAAGTPDWFDAARARPTPPWAQGADAVVLEDAQEVSVAASGRTVTTRRWAVRVLGPTGAAAAHQATTYVRGEGQVSSLQAWEVDANGTERQLGRKDAVDVAAAEAGAIYSDVRYASIAAIDPSPGTVFGAKVVLEEKPLFAEFHWWFDAIWPSLHSSFALTLPAGVEPVVHTGTKRAPESAHAGSTWTWVLTDMPARTYEPFAPVRGDDGSQVWVALRGTPGAAPACGATFASWPEVARWLDALEAPQCTITPAIAEHARARLGSSRDTLERLRALSRDVQGINYAAIELGLARGWGYRPHRADEVLAASYGDCKDKANLLCALLRAAGHEAWMVTAYSGGADRIVPDWPTPSQFNHCIVAMRVPTGTTLPAVMRDSTLGMILAFDPTDPLTPFGELPDDEQGSLVLIDRPEGSGLVRLPVAPPEARRIERSVHAILAGDGRLQAHVEESSRGSAATAERRLRRGSTQRAYADLLANGLAANRASVELGTFRTEEDTLAGTFHLTVDYAAPGFARTPGNGMLTFRSSPVSRRAAPSLPDSARTQPFRVPAECLRESVTVELPAGMRPDELPAAVDRVTDFGSLHAEWTLVGGDLRLVREQTTIAGVLPPGRYAEVRAFYALARKIQNTVVVLVRG